MIRQWTMVALVAGTVMASAASAGERSFTIANIDYEGSKAFVPSTIIVRKGDTVKLKLLNNIPGDPNQHGFTIPDFGVEAVVTRGEPKEVELVADREGLFPIKCHLHPAHLGGQLLVLPEETGKPSE